MIKKPVSRLAKSQTIVIGIVIETVAGKTTKRKDQINKAVAISKANQKAGQTNQRPNKKVRRATEIAPKVLAKKSVAGCYS